jgi:hypothetical protein
MRDGCVVRCRQSGKVEHAETTSQKPKTKPGRLDQQDQPLMQGPLNQQHCLMHP